MTDKLTAVLAERKVSHGDFKQQFECAQRIKGVLKDYGYANVPDVPKEGLDQIAHKLSRIVTGDPTFADHWWDIAGYATLIADMLDPPKAPPSPQAILANIAAGGYRAGGQAGHASVVTSPSQMVAENITR